MGLSEYNFFLINIGASMSILEQNVETFENLGILVFWTVDIFSQTTLLNVTLFHGCFSRFLNCTNGTNLRNVSHLLKWQCHRYDGVRRHCDRPNVITF